MPRAAGRPATGTILVPAFRRVHRCHPRVDRTSRSGAILGNAWTHRQTDKHDPANFFSPTHRRKSSFIRTCYAKALAPFILYDFGLVMELCRCTNFHVACSKYLEVRGQTTCTCVARAQCTTRPQVMYQRIALVKRFQCTKFRVASSKFPKSKGAYAYA